MTIPVLDEADIFKVACRIASLEARADYLQQVCGDDQAIFARMKTLLDAYDQQPSFLETPAVDGMATLDLSPVTQQIGSQIGPYKLRELLAEGGMGVVYVAEQEKPVRRKVALKIIKPGMATKDVLARFEAERQALAMMDHPNIASVLDGGATDSGQPYFVMELVHGLPITDYCDERRLSARQRVQIFAKVCRAVHHAHQKGIIHRDLKPSNVLVAHIDGEAVPKVIDFGVAKAVSQKLTEQTVYTQFSQMIGTPLYMSPEQAEMGIVDIDTRSDVYSLGALLYEMLTGNTPFDRETVKQLGFDELRRMVREDEPRRPSVAISTLQAQVLSTIADRRHIDPRKLSAILKGELDWLVMKALEKDRDRRYESASAFAADIEHYLNDEPVLAKPASMSYRFRKFAKRNRGQILFASLIATLLLAGVAVPAVLKFQSDQILRQVTQDVEQSLVAARTAIESEDLAVARQRIGEAQGRLAQVSNGLPQLASSVEQLHGEIDQRREQQQRFQGFVRLARDAMDGMSRSRNLGGDQLSLEALDLYGVLGDEDWLDRLKASYLSESQQETVRQSIFEALLGMADFGVRWDPTQEKAQDSLGYLQLAATFHEPTRAFYWVRSECHKTLEQSEQAKQDLTLFETSAATTAFDYYLPGHTAGWRGDRKAAIRSYEAALRIQPDHFNSLFFLAMRLSSEGRTTEAAQVYRACRALRPDHIPTLRNRADLLANSGENEEAIEACSKAIELSPNSASAFGVRSSVYLATGQHEKALADLDEALRLADLDDSTDTATKMNIYDHRADVFARRLQYDKALDDLNTAVELAPKIPDENSSVVLSHVLENRAIVFGHMGRFTAMLRDFDRAIEHGTDVTKNGAFNTLAWVLATCPDLAVRDIPRAIELASQAIEFAPDNGNIWNTLGVAQYRAAELTSAIKSLTQSLKLGDADQAVNYLFLAMAHWQLGHHEEAHEWYDKAAQWMTDNKSTDKELLAFYAEAEQTLGLDSPQSNSQTNDRQSTEPPILQEVSPEASPAISPKD